MDKLPGIFMNIFPDVSMNALGVRNIRVTKPIWKEGKNAYLELAESLTIGEIFQFKGSCITYRVVTHAEYLTEEGYTHQIRRTDNSSIVGLDISTSKNKWIKVINRETFREEMKMAQKVYPPYNKHK